MRDQYAGDISDPLKLSFLCALAGDDKTVGVGWYYNPSSARGADGRHREYCGEPKWKSLDMSVWGALRVFSEKSVAALERLSIWPAYTCFHRVPIPSKTDRHRWAVAMQAALAACDIVFLDPDNGVGKLSKQHATFDEIGAMRQPGRPLVVIKFPGREKHNDQLHTYHSQLRSQTGASSVVTIRTCVWLRQPRCRWFTVLDANEVLFERTRKFAQRLDDIEHCRADLNSE